MMSPMSIVVYLSKYNPSAEDLRIFFSQWSDMDLVFALDVFDAEDGFVAPEAHPYKDRIVNLLRHEIDTRINAALSS